MENYRAFRDEAVLDLRRPRMTPAGARAWDGRLFTVAAVYGANASGKSTLFRGLYTLRHLVRTSYRLGRVDAQPFRLDENSRDQPTYLSATFIADDGICYAYGFGIRDGRVVEEWAERYTTPRPTCLRGAAGSILERFAMCRRERGSTFAFRRRDTLGSATSPGRRNVSTRR